MEALEIMDTQEKAVNRIVFIKPTACSVKRQETARVCVQ